MEINGQFLNIRFCNFTNNTPLINLNTLSKGGAMFVKVNSIHIADCYFWKNVNQIGACIYVDQREITSFLLGLIENCVVLQNHANEDAGFLFITNGVISMYFQVKFSLIRENFGDCNNFIKI